MKKDQKTSIKFFQIIAIIFLGLLLIIVASAVILKPFSLPGQDTIQPLDQQTEITLGNPAERIGTGDRFVCNASVSDLDGIASVWLKYWFDSDPYQMVKMNLTGGTSSYETVLTIPSTSLDTLHYIVSSNDTKNHWNATDEHTVLVYDDDAPVLSTIRTLPTITSQNVYINISCIVSDNIAVDQVRLCLSDPNGTKTNLSMTKKDHSYVNQSYSLGGTYEFFIWSDDHHNNSIASKTRSFTIIYSDTSTLVLTMSGTGTGTLETNVVGPSYTGESVTVWANASADSTFMGFSGSLKGTTSPQTLRLNGDQMVNAVFTLTEELNKKPVNSQPYPPLQATGLPLAPRLAITVTDPDGDLMNLTFKTNATGTWGIIGTYTKVQNGTYLLKNASMDSSYTTYWWSVSTNDGSSYDNDTYSFTTALSTSINTMKPYRTSTSRRTITATGDRGLSNVTLYYRFSPDNLTRWDPGVDYLDIKLADSVVKDQDSFVNYPQRLWYDEENQRMYICGYSSDTLMIWNVTRQWDLKKETQLTSKAYFDYMHDIKVINNWSYSEVDYGNIALTVGGKAYTSFTTVRCNLSETPVILDNITTGSGYKTLGYLDYFINSTGHLIVVVTEMSTPGYMDFFDVSDPTDILTIAENVSTIGAKPWNPFFFNNGSYLVVGCQDPWNYTARIFNTSDLRNVTFVGPLYDYGDNKHWQNLLCFAKDDSQLVWSVDIYYVSPYTNTSLVVYNYSDPEHWVKVNNISVLSNGEYQIDYDTNAWVALRHFQKSPLNNTGLDFYNIHDPYNIYHVGYFSNPNLTVAAHMQWLDMKNNRGFFLSYTSHAFYALNLTVNLTHQSSWHTFETDTSYPWSWSFDFPEGPGYYEFCSIGKQKDIDNELFPVVSDARCYYFTS